MKCYAFLNGKVAAILIKAVTSLLLCRLFQASNIKKKCTLSTKQEEFEDTKGILRIHKSKNDRQYNGQ